MSTIKQITDSISGNLGKIDDFPFKKRVENSIIGARSEALRRDYNKRGFFPQSMKQSVPCLDLIEVNSNDCCSSLGSCKVYRTKEKIPTTIRVNDNVSFLYVGSTNGSKAFGYVDRSIIRYIPPFDKEPRYTVLNNYIYVFNTPITQITVEGVFNNPYEVAELNPCKSGLCEINVNIAEDLEYVIKQLVYEELRAYIPKQTEVPTNLQPQEDITKV